MKLSANFLWLMLFIGTAFIPLAATGCGWDAEDVFEGIEDIVDEFEDDDCDYCGWGYDDYDYYYWASYFYDGGCCYWDYGYVYADYSYWYDYFWYY